VHGALGEAAHPKQAFFEVVQIPFKMAFHLFPQSKIKKFSGRIQNLSQIVQ
jgi:hypothetical protein